MQDDAVKQAVAEVMDRALERLGQRQRGEWKVRPSGIHRCLRAQVLASELDPAETIQIPGKTALAFALGTAIHEVIQKVLPELPAEEQWQSPNMTGHSDLRMVAEGILVDLKTINVEGYMDVFKKGPKAEHVRQVSWYARFAGCKAAAIVYLNKNGTVPSTSKSVEGIHPTYLVVPVQIDAELVADTEDRAATVLRHKAAGTLPAYEEVTECRWCEVRAACIQRASTEQEWKRFHSKVVGVTFRAADFDLHDLVEGELLELEWEPDNQHGPRFDDGKAVAVKVLARGVHIGYLPASNAATATTVATHFRKGGTATCKVSAVTGGDAGKNKGVNIELELHGSDH